MANEWITAATALRYLTDDLYPYNEQQAICERAHNGLIAARAETLIWGDETRRNCKVPKEFWRAEREDDLLENWETGDFSTWIDGAFEAKAFGVSFDFLGVVELAPAEKRAAGMRRISVAANPGWIHSRDLTSLIYAQTNSMRAGAVILEACKLGQLTARAARVSITREARAGYGEASVWASLEWDVPLSFWRDFTNPNQSAQDWQQGTARGRTYRQGTSELIELQGLHLHRAGLSFLGLKSTDDDQSDAETPGPSNRGRKAKYDWPAATLAIFGRIHRGDFKPESQAEIEKALQAYLAQGDKEPSESTVRPYAKLIWDEAQQA